MRRKGTIIPQALKISYKETFYRDFDILHLEDKASEDHAIYLSYDSTRKVFIQQRLCDPGQRKRFTRDEGGCPNRAYLQPGKYELHETIY
ncbi:MAG: hypothetical protein QXQ64_02555 [Candidatus Bathyarchaeia archaeon]